MQTRNFVQLCMAVSIHLWLLDNVQKQEILLYFNNKEN